MKRLAAGACAYAPPSLKISFSTKPKFFCSNYWLKEKKNWQSSVFIANSADL
jgi:hypothetical protein